MRLIQTAQMKKKLLPTLIAFSFVLTAPVQFVFAHGGEDHGEKKPATVTPGANMIVHVARAGDFEVVMKHAPVEPDKEMVDLAVELIERKTGKFTPEQFENHYATALRELVQKKLKGQKIRAPHEEVSPGSAKVIDLMSALRKSIGDKSKGPGAKSKAGASARRRTPSGRGGASKKRA